MEKSEEQRKKWALGLTVTFSLFIFMGFAFYKGYIGFDMGGNSSVNVANVIAAENVPSPFQNTKQTFENAFGTIGEKYKNLKESISNVLVPFVTGIEVYER